MLDQVLAGVIVLLGLGVGIAALAKPVGEIVVIVVAYLIRLYSGLRRTQRKK